MLIIACAGYVGGRWCKDAASDSWGVAVEMWGWRLAAAGAGDAVAGWFGALVVFAVVVDHAAGGGGGGRVGFGDGEGGGVVVEGGLDGVGSGGEVALLGGRIGRLLWRVCGLLGRI